MIEKKVNNLPWSSNPFEAFLQRLLDRIEKDHCRKAYAHEIRFDEFMKNFINCPNATGQTSKS